jgi:hypothetical protein
MTAAAADVVKEAIQWGRYMQYLTQLVASMDLKVDILDFPQFANQASVVIPH